MFKRLGIGLATIGLAVTFLTGTAYASGHQSMPGKAGVANLKKVPPQLAPEIDGYQADGGKFVGETVIGQDTYNTWEDVSFQDWSYSTTMWAEAYSANCGYFLCLQSPWNNEPDEEFTVEQSQSTGGYFIQSDYTGDEVFQAANNGNYKMESDGTWQPGNLWTEFNFDAACYPGTCQIGMDGPSTLLNHYGFWMCGINAPGNCTTFNNQDIYHTNQEMLTPP